MFDLSISCNRASLDGREMLADVYKAEDCLCMTHLTLLLPYLSRSSASALVSCKTVDAVEHLYLTTHADDGMVLLSLVALLVSIL